jgi:hypothetical protein
MKERSIAKAAMTEATVVLTNFRFGNMDNFDGLASRLRAVAPSRRDGRHQQ